MEKVKILSKKTENLRKIEFKIMDEGNYQISNEGHIMSLKGNRKILKPMKKNGKYQTIYYNLWKDGKFTRYYKTTLMEKYFPK